MPPRFSCAAKEKIQSKPNPVYRKKPLAFARPRGPKCASRKKIPNCRRCDFFNCPQSRVVSRESAFVYDGSASGELYLDTPRVITDSQGNKVWEWQNTDPFGNNVPNENPNGAGTFSFNLRFPGQYFDKETGLHQNYFRDYDPANGGRYLQSDPIGLAGGSFSTYTYAANNPLMQIDPFGLANGPAVGRMMKTMGMNDPSSSLGISGTIGSTTVGINTKSSGAEWGQTTQISVGVGVEACFNIPKETNTCEKPESTPRPPDNYSAGLGKNLGITIKSNGSWCVNAGPSYGLSGGVGWDTKPH
jgi:RHS repeat-associated protein